MRRRDCNLQRRSLFYNILFRSGDIRDQVAKLSVMGAKFCCFLGSPIFWREELQNSGPIFTIEHVSKFDDDRLSDLGD